MSPDIKKVHTGGDDKKKSSGMNSAIKGTEAIRSWDDHRIGLEALAKKFNTDIVKGLTTA